MRHDEGCLRGAVRSADKGKIFENDAESIFVTSESGEINDFLRKRWLEYKPVL